MHPLSEISTNANSADSVEALLLRRAAVGDTRAYRELVALLARPALALAIRVMGDHALAEDAVQDALARLWREAPRFDPSRGSFGGWWRRMLMNCALDGRRRLKPVQPIEDASEVPSEAPGPQQAAETADLSDRVQLAMQSLPPRQRAALSLFSGEGLSMAEIGNALDTSEKAIEGLLLRARADLKTRLAGLKDELK